MNGARRDLKYCCISETKWPSLCMRFLMKSVCGSINTRVLPAIFCAEIFIQLLLKFRPIIEMYRVTDYDERAYEDWEYLAEKLFEFIKSRGIEGSRGDELRESPGTTI